MKRSRQIFVLSILSLLICASQSRGQTLPKFGHVVIVLLENTGFSDSSGSMPYLDSLVAKYGLATNYYADTHPSIGNYFTLTTGQILTNNDSQTPSSFPVSQANIASLLQAAGKTWKDYPEKTGTYYVHHDPLQYMTNVNKANLTSFTQFKTDLGNHALPNFSWITPNACDSAHDCGLSTADSWLQTNIDPLVKSTYFQPGGDGLLIILFDENDGSDSTDTTGTTDGGQVECVIVSPFIVSAGFRSTTRHYHESLLRLMEQGLGLATFAGASASANNMSEFFGAGATSTLSLSPASLTFANQTVGTTSAAQFSTLTNSGTTTITISSITLSGDFASAGLGTCGTSLAAGSSCTISVTFKPTATGTRTGSVTIRDSAAGSPQTITLTGSGVPASTPAASLSPTSLVFGNQTVGTASATKVVTLSNTGAVALSITSIAVAGTNSGDFTQTHTCLSSLEAGTSCTISVTFKPAAMGTRSASVSVTDNASGSPQSTSLTGSGATSSGSAPALVQVQNNVITTTTTYTSWSVNITTTAGDLLVAFCRESSNGTDNFTVTDSAGQTWTQTTSGYKNESSTGPRLGMFYVANSAAVTSVTVKFKTSGGVVKPGIMVYEISGAASSGVADGSVNNGTDSTTTSTSGSLTTSNANDMLIFATDTSGDESRWTAGAGYTIPNNSVRTGSSGSDVRMAMQYQVVTSRQTNASTAMTYANSNWNGNIFAAFRGR